MATPPRRATSPAVRGIVARMASAQVPAITRLVLENVRVFRARTDVPLGKLTLLGGANSSGKSSAMLGALLLKQTLDSTFDPGPLLLRGGHVALTSFDQLRARDATGPAVVGVSTDGGHSLEVAFERDHQGEIDVVESHSRGPRGPVATLRRGGTWRRGRVTRDRFLLGKSLPRSGDFEVPPSALLAAEALTHILHVPGLRTPPRRDYALTATGETFDGRFDSYVASVLLEWQRQRDVRIRQVGRDLEALGLTWKVQAERRGDTSVVLRVGRLRSSARGGAHDLVEIADVGVGVSQALPVVVALHRAQPGQVVYLEQPELHLHPRAQHAMARLLVEAAARGVRVVVETHSSILLLGVHAAALSEDRLDPADVRVNWFERDRLGWTTVHSVTLDRQGALEDAPVDFDEVELAAHREYLDAVESGP